MRDSIGWRSRFVSELRDDRLAEFLCIRDIGIGGDAVNDLQGGIFANEDDIPEVLAHENLLGNVVFELSIDMLYKEQLIRLLVRSSRGYS